MVVHQELPGFDVTVVVGSKALVEFRAENGPFEHEDLQVVKHHQEKTVTRYIQAQTDKKFGIKLSIQSPYKMDSPAPGFSINVDGQRVSHRL
jgi:hypothetical protein